MGASEFWGGPNSCHQLSLSPSMLELFSHTYPNPRLFARKGVSSGLVCENTRLLLRSKSKYTLQMVGMPNCQKKKNPPSLTLPENKWNFSHSPGKCHVHCIKFSHIQNKPVPHAAKHQFPVINYQHASWCSVADGIRNPG